jgi:hypothetical protein
LSNCVVGACYGREDLPLAEARSVAIEALRFTGLGDRGDVLAAQLTVAGKKRLELARALSAQPHLLLLDEALAGLNPTEVAHMIEVIRAIRSRRRRVDPDDRALDASNHGRFRSHYSSRFWRDPRRGTPAGSRNQSEGDRSLSW